MTRQAIPNSYDTSWRLKAKKSRSSSSSSSICCCCCCCCRCRDLHEVFLKPYFASFASPLRTGDLLAVSGAMRTVEFKVLSTTPEPCYVDDSTVVLCDSANPVRRAVSLPQRSTVSFYDDASRPTRPELHRRPLWV